MHSLPITYTATKRIEQKPKDFLAANQTKAQIAQQTYSCSNTVRSRGNNPSNNEDDISRLLINSLRNFKN